MNDGSTGQRTRGSGTATKGRFGYSGEQRRKVECEVNMSNEGKRSEWVRERESNLFFPRQFRSTSNNPPSFFFFFPFSFSFSFSFACVLRVDQVSSKTYRHHQCLAGCFSSCCLVLFTLVLHLHCLYPLSSCALIRLSVANVTRSRKKTTFARSHISSLECLLYYSCILEHAHTRLHSPSNHSEPKHHTRTK